MSALFQAEHTSALTPQREAAETLYLLDSSYRTVGVRPATGEEAPSEKEDFFRHYQIDSGDAALLSQVLRAGGEQSFLLASTGGPILVITAIFRRTGLLPVAVPHGALAEQLSAAHQYADALQATLFVSGRLQNRAVAPSAEGYYRISSWIAEMEASFFKGAGMAALPNCASALENALQDLARLCGCALDCELFALRRYRTAEIDLKLAAGAVLAALLLVHRVSADRRATLLAIEGDGREPKLKLTFEASAALDAVPELMPFADRALWKGELFERISDPAHPTHGEILFDPCGKELSVQGLKVRPLLGKSCPLPFLAE